MKKVRKNQWKKVIGLLMTVALCTGSMDMTPVQATELQEEQQIQISNDMSEIIVSENSVSGISVSGSDAVVGEEQDTEAVYETDIQESVDREMQKTEETEIVYETDNARITLTVVSAWDTAWQAQVTIENTGDMAIEDWSLRLPLQQEIKSIWNAQVVQTDEIGSEEGEKILRKRETNKTAGSSKILVGIRTFPAVAVWSLDFWLRAALKDCLRPAN